VRTGPFLLGSLDPEAPISEACLHREAAQEAYAELREALLGNMVRVASQTGFLWESYDDESGAGRGSHPFTGWSALLVLIAAELY
jgi:mannosyl-oligosaccharide glucosidase